MSKKNSSVSLKQLFKNKKEFSTIFLNFFKKISDYKKKSFVVAVSGGPDSLALAGLTKAYSHIKKTKFHYILINHNIRKNSSKEAKQVKNLLKKRKINLIIISNKKKIDRNIQGQAREIRYNLIERFCNEKKTRAILTAHNLEDQVETFLIRLSRGSGLTGLSSMKKISKISEKINLYRPLLDVKKDVLIKITKEVFGKYFKDPSNKDMKFLRTKIRGLKKPLERSGIKYDQIIKSINNLASSKETLDEYFEKIYKNLTTINGSSIFVDLKKFKRLNKDIKIDLINKSIKKLKSNYYNPRARKVENLIKKIQSKSFHKSTLGGCIFLKEKDKLRLKAEKT